MKSVSVVVEEAGEVEGEVEDEVEDEAEDEVEAERPFDLRRALRRMRVKAAIV